MLQEFQVLNFLLHLKKKLTTKFMDFLMPYNLNLLAV